MSRQQVKTLLRKYAVAVNNGNQAEARRIFAELWRRA